MPTSHAAAALRESAFPPPAPLGLLSSILGASSGAALLRAEARSSLPRIITFCAGLDRVLGGGVARGSLTEICGAPGVGKTQLAMQVALDAAIPRAFGGAGGEAIIIDSEGSILPERASAMAQALSKHLRRVVSRAEAGAEAAAEAAERSGTEEASAAAASAAADAAAKRAAAEASGSPSSLLSSVRVLRVRDAAELSAAVAALPALCDRHPRLALVAIDSIAFVWRASGSGLSSSSPGNATTATSTTGARGTAAPSSSSSSSSSSASQTASRARALSSIAASLSSLARERGLAVLLTNQVTTRPVAPVDRNFVSPNPQNHRSSLDGGGNSALPSSSSSPSSILVPALGDSWGHVPTTRLMLSWQRAGSSSSSFFSSSSSSQRRFADLVKSPSLPPGMAEFEVTGEGFRGPRSSVGGGGGGGGGRAATAAGAKRPLAA